MDASAATDGRREVVVSAQGLARTLHDGSIALVLLNRLDHGSSTLSVSWAELGGPPWRAACEIFSGGRTSRARRVGTSAPRWPLTALPLCASHVCEGGASSRESSAVTNAVLTHRELCVYPPTYTRFIRVSLLSLSLYWLSCASLLFDFLAHGRTALLQQVGTGRSDSWL